MAKVKAEKMTAAEARGDKTWFCQCCGSELAAQYPTDPSGSLKCPRCSELAGEARSWFATTAPSAEDVDDRQAELKTQAKAREDAQDAAKR